MESGALKGLQGNLAYQAKKDRQVYRGLQDKEDSQEYQAHKDLPYVISVTYLATKSFS